MVKINLIKAIELVKQSVARDAEVDHGICITNLWALETILEALEELDIYIKNLEVRGPRWESGVEVRAQLLDIFEGERA